ncbi:BZ3500_MvSof-1268-A1-R1_Chr6-3g08748 [Microbotryum saponariae]|uniref:BZ3500_MvSof-1268-A1-R1_Chr6-3g08748 protein n=1 Tax=Microbotryum saponariae TaxID=289078 RepID=A0A2X0MMJ7_9BASI|nr:BZ3500_MvSof-1268-A1-R1_Chr6-3g08748 [Microbotryum saponariae]SDA07349.1 BZ3501_MvSof-1269-A2-R1_Chr6-2g08451 [Microbotryum saponariae]
MISYTYNEDDVRKKTPAPPASVDALRTRTAMAARPFQSHAEVQQDHYTSSSKCTPSPSSQRKVVLRPIQAMTFFLVWLMSLYVLSPQPVSAEVITGRDSPNYGPLSKSAHLISVMTCHVLKIGCSMNTNSNTTQAPTESRFLVRLAQGLEETHRARAEERKQDQKEKHGELVHKTTQRVEARLHRANSIFHSLKILQDAGGDQQCVLGLRLFEAVPIQKMATDLKYSGLENAQILAQEAEELAKDSHILKDITLHIHSLGRKAFRSIPLYFEEIETLLQQVLNATTSKELSKLMASIDAKFEQLDSILQALLNKVAQGQALSARSSEQRIEASRASSPLLRSVLETTALVFGDDLTFHARPLKKNLALTHRSAHSVITLSHSLEDFRAALVTYKTSVGSYKANVIGYHLASLGLIAKEEARHLGKNMQKLKASVQEFIQASRVTQIQRLLPW